MTDFLVAFGLVFVIEGVMFAAFPASSKRAMMCVIETAEPVLRKVGIACAIAGLLLVWLMRG